MNNLLQTLQELHEDGFLWKAMRIWPTATNPDAQVFASENIVKSLICIPNVQKRNAYITRLCDVIATEIGTCNDKVTALGQELNTLQAEQDKLEKSLQKELSKKHKKSITEEELEEHNEYIEELKNLIGELPGKIQKVADKIEATKEQVVPKITATELTKLVKEKLDELERKLRQKIQQQAMQGKVASNETYGLPADFDGNVLEVVQFGIYQYRQRYYSRRDSENSEEISNFLMKVIYFVETSEDVSYRLIEIKNIFGDIKIIRINTDDMTSVSSFKKVISRRGNFIFKGNDSDLMKLAEYLQKDEKKTEFIDVLGYNPRGKFYAFANGLVDTSHPESGLVFHQIDEYGIVQLNSKNYFIPAMAKMYEDKDHLFQNEKKFVYIENNNINFKYWADLHYKVYGRNGLIGQLWYMLTLFMDVVYNIKTIRCTPILFLYGQRGAGKDAYADRLNVLYGYGQDNINLGSVSTSKGLLRKFAQFKNTFIWLNEYKNNIKKELIETQKGIYDHTGYTRAQKTTGFENESTPVNSAALLSGQELPIIEPALYTRVILCQFEPGKNRTEEAIRQFNKLKNTLEVHGLSCITVELLNYRPHFIEHFAANFNKLRRELEDQLPANIDTRYISNIAILYTIRVIFEGIVEFPYSIEETRTALVENLKDQFRISEGNDDLGKFWQVVQQMVSQFQLRHTQNYLIEDGYLYLKVQDVYPLYAKELVQRRDNNVLSKPALEDYLAKDRDTYVDKKKKRLHNKCPGVWCFQFKYVVLQERYELELETFSNTTPYGSVTETTQATEIPTPAGSISPVPQQGHLGNWQEWTNDTDDTEQTGTKT